MVFLDPNLFVYKYKEKKKKEKMLKIKFLLVHFFLFVFFQQNEKLWLKLKKQTIICIYLSYLQTKPAGQF